MKSCKVKADSRMMANHVEKDYIAREPMLAKYLLAVRSMEKYFKGFDIEYVERKSNEEADLIAKVAARKQPSPPDVLYKVVT